MAKIITLPMPRNFQVLPHISYLTMSVKFTLQEAMKAQGQNKRYNSTLS